MQAVDAIFFSLEELGVDAFDELPSDLLGSAEQPAALCDFTRHEVREAERFLARCGLLGGVSRGNVTSF